jgi:hypothetical protein
MRSDQHTVNDLTAYKLGLTQTASVLFISIDYEGGATAYFDIQIAVRHANGTEDILLNWYNFANRVSSGSGYQTFSFNCPQKDLTPTDAIVVRLRARMAGATSIAEFVTEQLGGVQLPGSTWTFYVYTYAIISRYYSVGAIYWGDANHNTRVENFTWTSPAVPPPAGVPRFIGDGLAGAAIIALMQHSPKVLRWPFRGLK